MEGDVLENFRPGIYRHYKGPLYQALFLAHDANVDSLASWDSGRGGVTGSFGTERIVVVYIALELNQAHTGVRPAVRTLEDWNAKVCTSRMPRCSQYGQAAPLGLVYCGSCRQPHQPRFEYVGVEYDGGG